MIYRSTLPLAYDEDGVFFLDAVLETSTHDPMNPDRKHFPRMVVRVFYQLRGAMDYVEALTPSDEAIRALPAVMEVAAKEIGTMMEAHE